MEPRRLMLRRHLQGVLRQLRQMVLFRVDLMEVLTEVLTAALTAALMVDQWVDQ